MSKVFQQSQRKDSNSSKIVVLQLNSSRNYLQHFAEPETLRKQISKMQNLNAKFQAHLNGRCTLSDSVSN